MSVPSKAKAIKLDNLAQEKSNQQPVTKLHRLGGNKQSEAVVRAVDQPQCASVKVLSPEIIHVASDHDFHLSEVSTSSNAMVSLKKRCRGLSPQRVDELIVLELGRTLQFLNVALRTEEVRE